MTDVTRGVIAGIGSGSKAHLTTIYTSGEKTFIRESRCGSVKSSGWSKSRTYGLGVEGPAFELSQEPRWPSKDSENYEAELAAFHATRLTIWAAHNKAEFALVPEFLNQANACSKCIKHAEWLAEKLAA